ncbi:Pycsar system effector family protein [Streptomyces litchfieldiae]|uniref:DUF5706 domain-containing protein n=1 Tax=Streptomyces litchfieldiae TaxID=3075543 RepID=A0ABU2MKJ2_9ACTN|nr:Pycsar system effector family protein [Streptomyces sp. DSM 44938]MDT0342015.1 DUF5706 domain-containing protein [Streptomyces sp. DSM 44938]
MSDPDPPPRSFPQPLAEQLLAEIRVEIGRADSKAAMLVAALGAAAALFGGTVAQSGWTPGALPVAGQVLWWCGTLSLGLSLAAFLLAVAPRYGRRRWEAGDPLTYFGDVLRAARQGELPAALAETDESAERRLVRALAINSRIAALKLRWVRLGLTAFAAGGLLLPMALLSR